MNTALFLLLLLLLLHGTLVAGHVRLVERDALWSLYGLTNGLTWRVNDGWNISTDPCRKTAAPVPHRPQSSAPVTFTDRTYRAALWHGVGCLDPCDDYLDGPSCTAGRISSIMLRNNSLHGDIAEWVGVGELRNLTVLDLSYNSLSGTLPTEFALIRNLDILQLRDNALSGDLPTELAAINSASAGSGELKEISLANNNLRGHLLPSLAPYAGTLRMLDLSYNSISGTLPETYASLPELQALFLRQNRLSGTLPAELGGGGGLAAMRFLGMQGNSFSGTLPPAMGGMTHLHSFELNGNLFSGSLPSTLGFYSPLTYLHINDNFFSGALPSELGQLTALETIDTYNNLFVGDMPSELGQLVNLRLLYLPSEQLLPLRLRYCQQRLPSVGKYSYRIVREQYFQMISAICPQPYTTLTAFGTLTQMSGDV